MQRFIRWIGISLLATCPAIGHAQEDARTWAATYPNEAVAADHALASQAGFAMLAQGGNAVDAAVATSFALSVVRPYSCGVGGGGFMIIHLVDDPDQPGRQPRTIALDYRERAPAAVTPDHFEDLPADASRWSGHAVAIPTTVAGLLHALERWGTLDRATVLAPAIRIAREGWNVDQHTYDAIVELNEFLEAQAGAARGHGLSESALFLRQRFCRDGAPLYNAHLALPEQADLLEIIAQDGRDGFYTGPVAQSVIRTIRTHAGIMALEDLRACTPLESEALVGHFRGRTILSMPLPSSGGVTFQQILGLLERRADLLTDADFMSPAYAHTLAEAMKHAFADRATWLGDPLFGPDPTPRLLDPAYLDERAARIDPLRTLGVMSYGSAAQAPEDGGTSHFCVIDRFGNAVACTETINLVFGSRIAVPEYGFLLNNEMDDFLTRRGSVNAFGLRQSDRNLPEPGKRPLSSMSPTIALDAAGNVELIAGASGGPRIITGTLQAMLNVMIFDMSAADAVAMPRLHHQWIPERLFLEEPHRGLDLQAWNALLSPAFHDALRQRGHILQTRPDIGNVQLIRHSESGWQAACDPRKGGAPAGQ
ncbi:MAG: gamma-glutamyltransferase [Phycisphaerales bacterium]|nr:gamma-glutamyltransferase [Phycisphaerales bacterium]